MTNIWPTTKPSKNTGIPRNCIMVTSHCAQGTCWT